jgi:hypothetical protein
MRAIKDFIDRIRKAGRAIARPVPVPVPVPVRRPFRPEWSAHGPRRDARP